MDKEGEATLALIVTLLFCGMVTLLMLEAIDLRQTVSEVRAEIAELKEQAR